MLFSQGKPESKQRVTSERRCPCQRACAQTIGSRSGTKLNSRSSRGSVDLTDLPSDRVTVRPRVGQNRLDRLLAEPQAASVQEGCGINLQRHPLRRAGGTPVGWASKIAIAVAVVWGSALSAITLAVDARAAGGPTGGMVTKVENQAQVEGQPVAVGSPVHIDRTVSTGAKGHLEVTFRDQTNLTLGENASVVIDRYVFDPDAGVGEAALNATRGAFRLATGRVSEMTKKNITVSTSFGALAVRGTTVGRYRLKGSLVSCSCTIAGSTCVDRTALRALTIASAAVPVPSTKRERVPTLIAENDAPWFPTCGLR